MEKLYEEASLKSGIYKISNKISGDFYIGSAKRFKERWRAHENDLKNGNHFNPRLQHSFNKYGSDAFTFEILEITEGDLKTRREIEAKYIKENWGLKCFNVRKDTIQKQGPWSSTPEETRKKMSESKKGKATWNKGMKGMPGKPHSEEAKQKMRGSRIVSDESHEKRSLAAKLWHALRKAGTQ